MDDRPPSISCWVHRCNRAVIQLTLGDDGEHQSGPACRLCGNANHNSQQEPLDFIVKLDCPLVSADHTSLELIIKPMSGTFLANFGNGSQLHIGVVNDQRQVLEYDHRGISLSDGGRWDQCLPLGLSQLIINRWDQSGEAFRAVWNVLIDELRSNNDNGVDTRWSAKNYDPANHNCFDFALNFVRKFVEKLHACHRSQGNTEANQGNGLMQLLHSCDSKEQFCQALVVPRMRHLARYLALYKETKSSVGFINNEPHNSLLAPSH